MYGIYIILASRTLNTSITRFIHENILSDIKNATNCYPHVFMLYIIETPLLVSYNTYIYIYMKLRQPAKCFHTSLSFITLQGQVTHECISALQWRHNEREGVSNRQFLDCLLNRLFRRRPKKTPKLRVTGICEGNPPVTDGFPSERASNAENVSIWWHHHGTRHHVVQIMASI